MQLYIDNQDALLFLQGSEPQLLAGLPAQDVAELRRLGWERFGPVAQQLMQGATNWTVAPAPSPTWAGAAYPDLPAEQRLVALWEDVFAAMRVLPQGKPGVDWAAHLAALQQRCASLNAQRQRTLRYKGEGTDLAVVLPPRHVWCTARLVTKAGQPFVANLPTEEVFTAPHRDSAEGIVTASRPISCNGAVIDGIRLEFKRGRVVAASARTGADLLRRLLDTDEGAGRLGEVAIVGDVGGSLSPASELSGPKAPPTDWQNSGRLFYHPLLDENAQSHIALGEAYGFCQQPPDLTALNRSLIHVDLPLAAEAILSGSEPT
jgi:aminopeptidase